jgi:hypothetical protein
LPLSSLIVPSGKTLTPESSTAFCCSTNEVSCALLSAVASSSLPLACSKRELAFLAASLAALIAAEPVAFAKFAAAVAAAFAAAAVAAAAFTAAAFVAAAAAAAAAKAFAPNEGLAGFVPRTLSLSKSAKDFVYIDTGWPTIGQDK